MTTPLDASVRKSFVDLPALVVTDGFGDPPGFRGSYPDDEGEDTSSPGHARR